MQLRPVYALQEKTGVRTRDGSPNYISGEETRRSVLGRQTFKVRQLPCGIDGSSDVWNWPASFRCIKDQSTEHERTHGSPNYNFGEEE
jgi:hypothetical protein